MIFIRLLTIGMLLSGCRTTMADIEARASSMCELHSGLKDIECQSRASVFACEDGIIFVGPPCEEL